jgi:hypothetical protein
MRVEVVKDHLPIALVPLNRLDKGGDHPSIKLEIVPGYLDLVCLIPLSWFNSDIHRFLDYEAQKVGLRSIVVCN